MHRLALASIVLGLVAAPAAADAPTLPKVGDVMNEQGSSTWPKMEWLYDVPSHPDAAGKVVVHWFCGPKVKTCADDLAHLTALRDTGKVYIVAYIDGAKSATKKLDPINGSEGVGKGTVAYGRGVGNLTKALAIKEPTSVVIDVDGKVQLISVGSTATEFDARDAKVNALAATIKEYTWSANDPKTAAPNAPFTLSVTVRLANWLKYGTTTPMSFALTQLPKDVKCDAKTLGPDKIKVDGQVATATVTCTAPFGSYEARGEIHFSYDAPGGGTGLGTEGAGWKVVVK